jgi:hypothetical protein
MEIMRGVFVVVAACAVGACGDSGSSDTSNEDAGNDAPPIDSFVADGSKDASADTSSHDADASTDVVSDAIADADAGPTRYNPTFPRLGLYPLGGSQRYDLDPFRAIAAKHHVVIVSHWPGWQLSRTLSMAAVMKDIQARSTIGTKTFIYVNDNERPDPQATGDDVWTELTAQKWWLYATGTTGSPVRSSFGTGYGEANNTLLTPKDSSGKDWISWKIDYDYAFDVAGDARDDANPYVDGFFLDNVFTQPRVDGDWDRDGVKDLATDPKTGGWARDGAKAWYDRIRAKWPGSLQLGNIGDFGDPKKTIGVLDSVIDGGVFEGAIGETWSLETWAGFAVMMDQYKRTYDATRAPSLLIFGFDNWTKGDWKTARYAMGACWMGDGYLYANTTYSPDDVLWFDEYDVDLGHPTQPFQTAAWSHGVWRRDFDKGIVLVNPKGNGVQTIDLAGTFHKIKGTQDATTNDGSTVTKVTIADRDGLVLLR